MVRKSYFPSLPGRFILFLACLFFIGVLPVHAGEDPFPVYDCIKPNVAFWKKVYSQYTTSHGLIHDNLDLSIVYEVVDLRPQDRPGARSHNRHLIKKVKEKYRRILNDLAAGKTPQTAEEKRVRALFAEKASAADFRDAAGAIRFQLCQKDRFEQGLVRSGAYLEEIKSIFRSYGLSEDLAYLPHVESSFNYKAYSKFGAAGIWQFTRATGKRFMTVDYALDERRDPIRATHAAARYLKENYEKLGNWPLALTAYNHGANGMMRAKKQKGSYENIFHHYDSRRFGFASRNFYSEFIAARHVAKNYRKYFGDLRLDPPVPVHEVAMAGYAPIKDLARHFQVDLPTLTELNPALRPPVFEARKFVPKGYKLRLPNGNGEMERLASLIPDDLFRSEQKRSRFYRVEKGDTAGIIARRHGVKLQDLIMANGLNSRATIYAGQNLRIPVPEESVILLARAETPDKSGTPPLLKSEGVKKTASARAASKAQADKAVRPAQPEPAASEPVLLASAAVEEGAGPGPVIPVVAEAEERPAVDEPAAPVMARVGDVPGPEPVILAAVEVEVIPSTPVGREPTPEMVASLGWAEKVATIIDKVISVEEEKEEKAMEIAALDASSSEPEAADAEETVEETAPIDGNGAALDELPPASLAAESVNPSVVIGDLRVENVVEKNGRLVGTIKVEVGETLGHYADWLQVPTSRIRRLNGLRYGKAIHLGQRLKIAFDRIGRDDFEERRYEYHKEIEEDFFAAYKIVGARLYRIRPGDNIWNLCQDEFDLPFWLIQKYNASQDFNNLKPDQEMVVPVVRQAES